jgi:hypothetical protein
MRLFKNQSPFTNSYSQAIQLHLVLNSSSILDEVNHFAYSVDVYANNFNSNKANIE